jgi:hypothetical protein
VRKTPACQRLHVQKSSPYGHLRRCHMFDPTGVGDL